MCWGAQFDCFPGISRWCWARILSTYSSLPEYFGWSDVSSKVSLINDLVSFRNSLLLLLHLPCLAIDWNSDGKMWIWAMFSAGLWQMHFQELYFPMRLAFTLISKKLRKLHNQDYHFSITFIWWYWITFAKIKRPHLNLEGKEPAMTEETCRESHSARSLALVPNFPFLVSTWGDQLFVLLSTL